MIGWMFYLAIVVFDLDPSALCGDNARPDGDVELSTGDRFDPDVVSLKKQNKRFIKLSIVRRLHFKLEKSKIHNQFDREFAGV